MSIVNVYKERPSTIIGITDEYTAYCFDEVCTYLIKRIENGDEPNFGVFNENRKHYSSFSEMYKHI